MRYPKQDLLHIPMRLVDHSFLFDDQAALQGVKQKLIQGKEISLPSIQSRSDGYSFPVDLNIRQIENLLIVDVTVFQDLQNIVSKFRENESRIADAIAAADAGTFFYSFKSDLLIWNQRSFDIYAFMPEDFTANLQAWKNLVFPEDWHKLDQLIHSDLKAGDKLDVEFRIQQKDIGFKYIRAICFVKINGKENTKSLTGLYFDITNQRKTEFMLRESNERFQKLASNIQGVIYRFVIDPVKKQTKFEFLSPAIEQLFGIPFIEVKNNPSLLRDYVHPDDVALFREKFNKSVLEATLNFEWKGRIIVGGEEKWVSLQSVSTVTDEGILIREGFAIDITKQKVAETELQSAYEQLTLSQQQIDFIFQNSFHLIVVTDEKGRITRVNKTARTFLGMKNSDNLGDVFWLLAPFKEEIIQAEIAENFNTSKLKRETIRFEIGNRNPKIKEFDLDLTIKPLLADSGEVSMFIVEGRDISEEKTIRKALVQSERNYRTLFEHSLIGVMKTTLDGEILLINDSLASLFEGNKNDIPKTYNSKYFFEDKTHRQRLIDDLIITGKIDNELINLKSLKGKKITALLSASLAEGVCNAVIVDISLIKRREKEKNIQLQLNALSAQMNPHFIFNSLNSLQYYVLGNNQKDALDYISKFSNLTRTALQNSRKEYISINDELNFLKTYLEIEQLRFDDDFDFMFDIDENIDQENYFIPPMIIQPYVENALIHGLKNKSGNKNLLISVIFDQDELVVRIKDDGIGYKQGLLDAKNRGAEHVSLGTQITEARLAMLQNLEGFKFTTEIYDLKDEGRGIGTEVVLSFPQDLLA